MKRFAYVGIAVVAILGIAITMALVSNPALADRSTDDGAAAVESQTEQMGDTTAPVVDLAAEDGETAVLNNGFGDNFIDEDGDGVCDTCDNVPGTGTGNPNNAGSGSDNFVDEDGDGVCDDCGTSPADGAGNQYGNGSGGDNFVDEDGDGVCDDCGTSPADGTGNQYGRQGGNTGKGTDGARGQGQRGGQRTNTP